MDAFSIKVRNKEANEQVTDRVGRYKILLFLDLTDRMTLW